MAEQPTGTDVYAQFATATKAVANLVRGDVVYFAWGIYRSVQAVVTGLGAGGSTARVLFEGGEVREFDAQSTDTVIVLR